MKYVVCYSGGHSSALVAIETVRRYGKENVILLNHNISSQVEHQDIKRFKEEVASYLDIPITYANHERYEEMTPINVCLELGGYKFNNSPVLCTYHLKTLPFEKWLKENYPTGEGITIMYGFDKNEQHRIQRRTQILGLKGYKTEYPLAYWERTIENVEEIGINRPIVYKIHKHANCIGCLKSGVMSWYLTYCLYPDIFEKALQSEEEIGFSIIKDNYLSDLIPKFKEMKCRGIKPNEKIPHQTFWAQVRKELKQYKNLDDKPCQCSI